MKKQASSLDMLHGNIAVKMILFAIPVALSTVLQQMFNVADMVVVGRFSGSNSLAAVGANTFVINLMVNLFVGLSIGANVVIAKLIGSNKQEEVHQAVHTSIAISILSGILLAMVGWVVASPVLRWMGTPDAILSEAVKYFRIYFLSMPFGMLFNFCTAILRSKGDTKRPLYVLAVSGGINALLNLLFVAVMALSVTGVALATLISSAMGSIVLLRMLVSEESIIKVRLRQIRIHRKPLLMIASVGLPAGIQGAIFNISNVLVQSGINSLGANAVAAATAALNFEYLSYFVQNAFAQAGLTFLSQNYGAGQTQRCKSIAKWALVLGVGSTMAASWSFVGLRHVLAACFTSNAEVALLTAMRIQVVCMLYFVNSFIDILSSLMRALGHSALPALICVVGICGVRVVWLYTAFAQHPVYDMLNYCYPLSWIACALVMMPTAYIVINRTLKQKHTIL